MQKGWQQKGWQPKGGWQQKGKGDWGKGKGDWGKGGGKGKGNLYSLIDGTNNEYGYHQDNSWGSGGSSNNYFAPLALLENDVESTDSDSDCEDLLCMDVAEVTAPDPCETPEVQGETLFPEGDHRNGDSVEEWIA